MSSISRDKSDFKSPLGPTSLAEQINAEHRLATQHAVETVDHAIRCGELLTRQIELLGIGHGGDRQSVGLWGPPHGATPNFER